MAEYQKVVIDQFNQENHLRKVTPRSKPDLPGEITGTASWYESGKDENKNHIPPSYHCIKDNLLTPIEFINNQWYELIWDSTPKFRGYWAYYERQIQIGMYELGYLGNILEAKTPIAGSSTFRERAESSSTQPEKKDSDEEEEDEPIDNDPVQTEQLANIFEENPIFEDIAEEIDPPQDRRHYLPTIIPGPQTLRPVGINPTPLKARATREETLAATTDTAKLITNSIKLDGSLKGKVPEPFDGDRTKTQKFINAFSLFWMNNEENSHMKNPYKRCTYFLGLFSGDKVDDWVQDQTEQLKEKTTRNLGRIGKDQEELWVELTTAFSNAFTHTGRVEQARTELAKLEMEGDQIDEYIAKFENLLCKADIPRTEVGSIQKFKEGLRKGVLAAILRRDQWPETIDA